jgi:hypothetical protein
MAVAASHAPTLVTGIFQNQNGYRVSGLVKYWARAVIGIRKTFLENHIRLLSRRTTRTQ